MPILAVEPAIFPNDLLESPRSCRTTAGQWWVLYTLSRQEKPLMRRLHRQGVSFYTPMVARRHRSPAGRLRVSHLPLFSNYVFMYGDDEDRRLALTTNCVSRTLAVEQSSQLVADLRQIHRLIAIGTPLTPERQLTAGQMVRVRNGPFRGFEGVVLRREGEQRLLVAVNFLQQGASVLLDDCQLEAIT